MTAKDKHIEVLRKALFEIYMRTCGSTPKEEEVHKIAWDAMKYKEE